MDQFVVDRLRASLRDRVTTPADAGYDAARATFNATVGRRPAVIVRVRTVEDVVAAVVAAGDLGLPIAVRGGGHSVAGHAMADGALVVDLRDRCARSPSTPRRASSGSRAARNGRMSTRRPGRMVWPSSAGRSATPGVGGLTLGGGIGWLSASRASPATT